MVSVSEQPSFGRRPPYASSPEIEKDNCNIRKKITGLRHLSISQTKLGDAKTSF
jgi:hypothetical protein